MTTESVVFALLRTAVCEEVLSEEVVAACTPEMLSGVYSLAAKHDLAHLVGHALEKTNISQCMGLEKSKVAKNQAIYRYMRQDYEYGRICSALEKEQIPFIPLKGAVLRGLYPEPWMRTSCDLDILVHLEDVAKGADALEKQLSYKKGERGTHDVALQTPGGICIELHFDLVEEGRANFAKDVLCEIWQAAVLRSGWNSQYDLSDAYLYFYHIAHMAKHFEVGGCGIRSLIDLWLLENKMMGDTVQRNLLLEKAGLLSFALAVSKLSRVWIDREDHDQLSCRLEKFILEGGTLGSASNRVALNQKAKGGRVAYLLSRIIIPYEKLKRYYPILEKYPCLSPIMQVRRWFMLLRPHVARMAKRELETNMKLTQQDAKDIGQLLEDIGIDQASW